MKKNTGREQFDTIQIPEDLGDAVKKGIHRGKRHRALQHTLSYTAVAVAIIFVTANIPVLYARAAELPLLAPLVRVMRIGNGGEQVTGAVPHVQPGKDRIWISFTDEQGDEMAVPVFSAVQRKAPQRVTLRLHGLSEELSMEKLLKEQEAVSVAYPVSATDPAERGVTFHLKPGWTCAVGQYANTLELQFSQGEVLESAEYYVLRSAPVPQGKALAELTESLLWEGATQLRLPTGEYCVTLGEFSTEARAEQAQKSILKSHGTELQVVHFCEETE